MMKPISRRIANVQSRREAWQDALQEYYSDASAKHLADDDRRQVPGPSSLTP
ncbi:hypothetical protein KCP76_06075 [Salmonella enterica subsp. enterica serovar Weltevreden]|nr:hypothetical protein KCP76_06075 [Salmonella enterica subsp. enterica serovar Weltevreden]